MRFEKSHSTTPDDKLQLAGSPETEYPAGIGRDERASPVTLLPTFRTVTETALSASGIASAGTVSSTDKSRDVGPTATLVEASLLVVVTSLQPPFSATVASRATVVLSVGSPNVVGMTKSTSAPGARGPPVQVTTCAATPHPEGSALAVTPVGNVTEEVKVGAATSPRFETVKVAGIVWFTSAAAGLVIATARSGGASTVNAVGSVKPGSVGSSDRKSRPNSTGRSERTAWFEVGPGGVSGAVAVTTVIVAVPPIGT